MDGGHLFLAAVASSLGPGYGQLTEEAEDSTGSPFLDPKIARALTGEHRLACKPTSRGELFPYTVGSQRCSTEREYLCVCCATMSGCIPFSPCASCPRVARRHRRQDSEASR